LPRFTVEYTPRCHASGNTDNIRKVKFMANFSNNNDIDALFKAQDLIYDSWEAETKAERIKLAHQAIALSEDCADAYALLAREAAKNIVEERKYYEQAVAAGIRAIGEDGFKEYAGHFWGFLETRPYMRARAGLAECLWDMGERAESTEHLQDMLKLNPGDNQGLRYRLTFQLIAQDDLAGADALLSLYEDKGFAHWEFNKALLEFKRNGSGKIANKALASAHENNGFVVGYLNGQRTVPKKQPPGYSIGSKEEAILYAQDNLENWKTAKGALQWITQRLS